jgi:hypothetical protein
MKLVYPVANQQPLLGSFIILHRPSPDHFPIIVQISPDFRFQLFLLFLLNKRNTLEKSNVY